MKKIFYVYEWFNINTNKVFYVGKGKGKRYRRKDGRNRYFTNYIKKYNCNSRIIKSNLTEQEAWDYEIYLISYYRKLGECQCNIADGGEGGVHLYGEKNPMYHRTWWNDNTSVEKINKWKNKVKHIGEDNPMYGVSPKERMDEHTYKSWRENHKKIIGKNNPNYGNNTLKIKYAKNPKLAKEKQSRPKGQNGNAKKIYLYNLDMELIKGFEYIGECIQYLIENNATKAKSSSIYSNIWKSMKENKSYLKYYFSFELK